MSNAEEQHYCKVCYREISSEAASCLACASESATGRNGHVAVLLLGITGLPVLIVGVLTLNARFCLAGGLVSAAAALLYAVFTIRQ